MTTPIFFIAGIIAFLLTAALVPVARWLAFRYGVVATPGGRHVHAEATPKWGGIAIVGSILLTVVGTLVVRPEALRFVADTVLGIDRNLVGVIIGVAILFVTGLVDDRYDLPPLVKLALQTLAALAVVAFGIQIHWLANPFGGLVIVVGNWSYLLVPLWLLAMVNVMNWFDGLDGLTSGLTAIAALTMVVLSLTPAVNQPATALLAAIVAGAALGFLPWNWYPAKIFMGDSGSMVLGFLLGVFAIISGAKFATAALVLGIPILDAVWVVGRRFVTGQSLMQADRKHLHHRLLDVGLHPRAAVLALYALASTFGLIALRSGTAGKVIALEWLAGLMVVIAAGLYIGTQSRRIRQK